MKVILEREADAEMVEAAQYYDEQQPGLGSDFLDKVDAAVAQIGADPVQFAFYRGSKIVRSVRLARFPYRLLFVVEPARISVVAVAHLHPGAGSSGAGSYVPASQSLPWHTCIGVLTTGSTD